MPLSAWGWRFNKKLCGGGPLVFDHGYHLFSLASYLGGPVEKVYAWIGETPVRQVAGLVNLDAPAMIMFQYRAPGIFGSLDIQHTPDMRIHSEYYADDNRIEIIGEKGILFINRYTTKTVDLPALMLFRDGKTEAIPVENTAWQDSFTAASRDFIHALQHGSSPRLDGPTGKAVLPFTLAAIQSAAEVRTICPDDVP